MSSAQLASAGNCKLSMSPLTAPAVLKINDGAVGCSLNRVGWDWASTAAISILQGIFANRYILQKNILVLFFPTKEQTCMYETVVLHPISSTSGISVIHIIVRCHCVYAPKLSRHLAHTGSAAAAQVHWTELSRGCIFSAEQQSSAVPLIWDRGEWSQHPVEENTEISPNNNKQQQTTTDNNRQQQTTNKLANKQQTNNNKQQQTTQIPQQIALGWHT